MSVADVEPNLSAAMTPILAKLQKNCLHAQDMLPAQVAEAANAISDALDAAGPWTFWTYGIHKPYLPTTKVTLRRGPRSGSFEMGVVLEPPVPGEPLAEAALRRVGDVREDDRHRTVFGEAAHRRR